MKKFFVLALIASLCISVVACKSPESAQQNPQDFQAPPPENVFEPMPEGGQPEAAPEAAPEVVPDMPEAPVAPEALEKPIADDFGAAEPSTN